MVEIPYELAYNIVYAGLEFAAEYKEDASITENKWPGEEDEEGD